MAQTQINLGADNDESYVPETIKGQRYFPNSNQTLHLHPKEMCKGFP